MISILILCTLYCLLALHKRIKAFYIVISLSLTLLLYTLTKPESPKDSLFAKALIHYAHKNYTDSLNFIKKACEKHPESTLYKKAHILIAEKN